MESNEFGQAVNQEIARIDQVFHDGVYHTILVQLKRRHTVSINVGMMADSVVVKLIDDMRAKGYVVTVEDSAPVVGHYLHISRGMAPVEQPDKAILSDYKMLTKHYRALKVD
jgi:hypothetical protein